MPDNRLESLSIDELIDELERQGAYRRQLLNLPFECRFNVDTNEEEERANDENWQVQPQRNANFRSNRASYPNINGMTSSHPSDPMLLHRRGEEIDLVGAFPEEMKRLQSIDDVFRRRKPNGSFQRVYRDGIHDLPFAAIKKQSSPLHQHFSSRLALSSLSSNNIIPAESTYRKLPKSHRSAPTRKTEHVDDICQNIRRMRHRFEEAERKAARRQTELKDFQLRSHDVLIKQRDVDSRSNDGPESRINYKKCNEIVSNLPRGNHGFQSRSGDFPLKRKNTFTKLDKPSVCRLSESVPSSLNTTNAGVSMQRLEAAGRRFPQLQKALAPVLGMRQDKNLVFEFMEMLDRRVKICEDHLRRMMRERCSVPKSRRQLANYEICAQQKDITMLRDLSTNIRSRLKIAPTDDYIQRQLTASKQAPERRQQLNILETSIGQVFL